MHKSFVFSSEPVSVPLISTVNRQISTPIPAPGTQEIIERLTKVESRSMQGQMPIVWSRASDYSIYDISNNKFIDFTSTIFVANVGHSNPRVIEALRSSLDSPLLSCYAYSNTLRCEYIEKLVEFAGPAFQKAFLLSAGTEATEACLKLMKMNGIKRKKKKLGIICIENNWHGRTMGAQMMSSNTKQKEWITHCDPDIHHIPFPYPWNPSANNPTTFLSKSLDELGKKVNLSTDICGVMLETFQGWGAVFYPIEYVQAIRKFCDENGLLLCFDEMQAGFARTGKNFGFEHYNVTPDLIACGKGMGGGLPLSGVIGKSEIMDLPDVGNMSSTHSANPLVCAAGSAVIEEILSHSLCEQALTKGSYLKSLLLELQSKYPMLVSFVLGEGLILALHFHYLPDPNLSSYLASNVCEMCYQKGLLLVHTGRESIKIGPPLTIPKHALSEAVSIIDESICNVLSSL